MVSSIYSFKTIVLRRPRAPPDCLRGPWRAEAKGAGIRESAGRWGGGGTRGRGRPDGEPGQDCHLGRGERGRAGLAGRVHPRRAQPRGSLAHPHTWPLRRTACSVPGSSGIPWGYRRGGQAERAGSPRYPADRAPARERGVQAPPTPLPGWCTTGPQGPGGSRRRAAEAGRRAPGPALPSSPGPSAEWDSQGAVA